jgi:ribosome-associated protein
MVPLIQNLCLILVGCMHVAHGLGTTNYSRRENMAFAAPITKNSIRNNMSLFAEISSNSSEQTPLCDLQTFLKLTSSVQSGGEAKAAIQAGQCYLNGEVEIRRAKKLFRGDEVFFDGTSLDVLDEVLKYGYVYKAKKKKVKPVAKVDGEGNLEFGGRYRSEEWRSQRKERKAERKNRN